MRSKHASRRAVGRWSRLSALGCVLIGAVACGRAGAIGAESAPTAIPQPTPDRTMEAVIRGSPALVSVASDPRGSPTLAQAAARNASPAPAARATRPATGPTGTAVARAGMAPSAGIATHTPVAPLPATSTPVPAVAQPKPAVGPLFGPTPVRAGTPVPARTPAPAVINPGVVNPNTIVPSGAGRPATATPSR